jgi:hypothetical protein
LGIFLKQSTTLCQYVLVGTAKVQISCGVKDQAGQRLKLHNDHYKMYQIFLFSTVFFNTGVSVRIFHNCKTLLLKNPRDIVLWFKLVRITAAAF